MPPELVTRIPDVDEASDQSWWEFYRRSLDKGGLSETAREIVDLDSGYIVSKGVFGVGAPGAPNNAWPSNRLRKGLVIGSVQSGKTASMLAVAAKCLDLDVDMVVFLTGTRIALWKQTFERAVEQLDGWSPNCNSQHNQKRVWIPSPELISKREDFSADFYHTHRSIVKRNLAMKRPFIAIVMKQADHLIKFGKVFRDCISGSIRSLDRPLNMLVVDDEADDGSILDAVLESTYEPDSLNLKQVPRHIARLWSGQNPPTTTFDKNLFATYLAYTATPQSNILQSDFNPLSPTDFIISLRVPSDKGEIVEHRESTYREKEGVGAFYIGGEYFYKTFCQADGGLCVPFKELRAEDYDSDEEMQMAVQKQKLDIIGCALRSYFVSAALRLLQSDKSFAEAQKFENASLEAILESIPKSHSMLVNPSADIGNQFFTTKQIANWSIGIEGSSEFPADGEGRPCFSPEGLALRLENEEYLWKEWLQKFEKTRELICSCNIGDKTTPINLDNWEDVKETLVSQVFPHVSLRTINSDPLADDRPIFSPTLNDDGSYSIPRDLLTVFVSGNVMSRGITLENLVTSVFVRDSNSPAHDTQAQMQRWFGYRGGHLPFCRLFLSERQMGLFRSYHENEEALKAEVIHEMNANKGDVPSPLILQGKGFCATAKIANLSALPLCPGPQPFVRVVEQGGLGNRAVLGNLLDSNSYSSLTVGSKERGLIFNRKFSFVELASILEQFRYTQHRPCPSDRNHQRWESLEKTIDVPNEVRPFFRPPSLESGESSMDLVSPNSCPYSIAAYLRLWDSALSVRVRGLFPTDSQSTPWSMINLSSYASSAPDFYIGVRFGDEGLSSDSQLANHGVKTMSRKVRDGIVKSTWGTRNPTWKPGSYFGDTFFDYHVTEYEPVRPIPRKVPWRPRGHPGLLLFHLIKDSEDRELLTMGVCLPIGGPDHFAAVSPE